MIISSADHSEGFITADLDRGIRKFQRDPLIMTTVPVDPPIPEEKPNDGILKPLDINPYAMMSYAPETKNSNASDETPLPPKPKTKPDYKKASAISVFEKFRENLIPREGGIANRSKEADPGGLTNKGISQEFLDDLNRRSPELKLPKKSTDLDDHQIDKIFKEEFFDRPQIGELNDIAGYDKTGSKLVEHVFDATVMTRDTTVGTWLQESIDETIGTDLKINKNGKKQYDGIMGSKTRAAMQKVVDQDKTKKVSRKFWQKRYDYYQNLKNAADNPGWWPRLDEFNE